ncbi:MAG: ATP-grasp domain-containing protein [Frankiaceae bacterium]
MPAGSVVVLEEPHVIERRCLGQQLGRHPLLRDLIPVQLDGALPALQRLTAMTPVEAVIPGTELGVTLAAELAEALRLPGAGSRAGRTFRDKLALRAAAAAMGVRQPRWREVTSPTDVRAAMRELGGESFVLKPANLAGSQGVVMLDTATDVDEAWRATTAGRSDRPEPSGLRFLVEERLTGPEISVECLVSHGRITFTNTTDKHVLPGPYPVEVGHVLPRLRSTRVAEELAAFMSSLVTATGMGDGILHGEWILTTGGPALVECAARIPGDNILALLDLAYGTAISFLYLEAMAGRSIDHTPAPERGAAVRYLTPRAGTVRRVSGVAAAREVPGVHEVVIGVAPGEPVNPLRASYDRVGYVIATGAHASAAWDTASRAAALVTIETD